MSLARTSYQVEGGVAREIHTFVKLATGSCHDPVTVLITSGTLKKKAKFDVRACPDVRVHCMCVLIKLMLALKLQVRVHCSL